MHIILVPSTFGKGHNITLTQPQLLGLGLILFLLLPGLLGTLAYRIQALTHTPPTREPLFLQQQAQRLAQERAHLVEVKRDADSYLQAVTHRLGELQAQVLRLNALGSRLAQLAGVDKGEFDFNTAVGVGGPSERLSDARAPLALNELSAIAAMASGASRPAGASVLSGLEQLGHDIETKSLHLDTLEGVLRARRLKAAATPLGWPVSGGWLSSNFGVRADPFTGRRAYHEGVDIANRFGAEIRAMAAGIVTYAGPRDGYGLMVEITHGRGQATRYAHAQAVLVKAGDRVTRGQAIARVGSSGRSTGPHLHFEVLQGGRQVDPRKYLRQS